MSFESRGAEVKQSTEDVRLSVGADEIFLPLVTAFVEKSANCFGLGVDESLRLTLAAEEVFLHLCRAVMPSGGPVEIVCSSGGYYAQAVFLIPTDAFDLGAFNLTATIATEDDADLDAMGLVLASRSVDRFFLSRKEGRDLRLTLIKEKAYPTLSVVVPAVVGPLGKTVQRPPGPEEVKFISQLAVSHYDSHVLSDIMLSPGKLADMIGVGEYDSLAAVGSAGEIGGAIFWHWFGENMVECFGPYVFNQDPESKIPEELLHGCLGAVARTKAVGVINLRPTPEFSRMHFELLGTLDYCVPEGSCVPVEAWFRLLHEDSGAAIWVHPGLDAFVRREYARLVLPREIRIDRPAGENLPRHSVISAEFDRLRGLVTLRPMWPGADVKENIEQHVRLMESEKILNIHFIIDLGQAWQTVFVPGLLDSGFEPRLVLPYAGKGDLVVFQLGGNHAS
jgi:hypothetical protein